MCNYETMSKFLSLVLRHRPDILDLNMDKAGWVSVDELIDNLNKDRNEPVNLEDIKRIVATNNKQRFDIIKRDNCLYIRANQGHSIKDLDMEYEPVNPPDILYHGTGKKYLNNILKEGLLPKNRQYVHLSSNIETAISVGQRHGKPVVLEIDSKKMSEDGIIFYCSKNKVWLTNFVDKKYLKIVRD